MIGMLQVVTCGQIQLQTVTQNFPPGRRQAVRPPGPVLEEPAGSAACSGVFCFLEAVGRPRPQWLWALTWGTGTLLLQHS